MGYGLYQKIEGVPTKIAVGTNDLNKKEFMLIAGANVVINRDNPDQPIISVPGVPMPQRFTSTQEAVGQVGDTVSNLNQNDTHPMIPSNELSIDDIVIFANGTQGIVVEIDDTNETYAVIIVLERIDVDAANVSFESQLDDPTNPDDVTPLASTTVADALDELTERAHATDLKVDKVDEDLTVFKGEVESSFEGINDRLNATDDNLKNVNDTLFGKYQNLGFISSVNPVTVGQNPTEGKIWWNIASPPVAGTALASNLSVWIGGVWQPATSDIAFVANDVLRAYVNNEWVYYNFNGTGWVAGLSDVNNGFISVANRRLDDLEESATNGTVRSVNNIKPDTDGNVDTFVVITKSVLDDFIENPTTMPDDVRFVVIDN